jgi:hypothetical protein
MRQSSYFAPDRDGPPQRSVLTALRTRKRRSRDEGGRAGGQVEDTAVTPLSEMEKQVVRLRRRHPDTLLLFECGYRMRIFAEDAAVGAQHDVCCLLSQCLQWAHTLFALVMLVALTASCGGAGHPSAATPELPGGVGARASDHVPRAAAGARGAQSGRREAGGLGRRAGQDAGRPTQTPAAVGDTERECCTCVRWCLTAVGGVTCRRVTEIYTRATIPELEGRGEDSEGEEDTRARFIACVVEATLHSKPFFSQSMHEADEEIKRSQVRSCPVAVGSWLAQAGGALLTLGSARRSRRKCASVSSRTTSTLGRPSSTSSRTVRLEHPVLQLRSARLTLWRWDPQTGSDSACSGHWKRSSPWSLFCLQAD